MKALTAAKLKSEFLSKKPSPRLLELKKKIMARVEANSRMSDAEHAEILMRVVDAAYANP